MKQYLVSSLAAIAAVGIQSMPSFGDPLRIKYAAKTRDAEQPTVANAWRIREDSASFMLSEGAVVVPRIRNAVRSAEDQYLEATHGRGPCASQHTLADVLSCAWQRVPNHSGLTFAGLVSEGDHLYFSQDGDLRVLMIRGRVPQQLQGKIGVVQVKPGDTFILASGVVAGLGGPAIASLVEKALGNLERAAELLTEAPPPSKTTDATALLLRFAPPQ
jgi:hypothetical protein